MSKQEYEDIICRMNEIRNNMQIIEIREVEIQGFITSIKAINDCDHDTYCCIYDNDNDDCIDDYDYCVHKNNENP